MAHVLTDLKWYQEAREILMKLNHQEPMPEAYYWLARIAELEKNWDAVELAIQKATVLDPRNSNYHLKFSQVLKRLRKLERAEKEAALAIKYQVRPSPWFFNHRAWIRWTRQNYTGAIEDWKSAIKIKPDRADFHAHIAEAYRKLENPSLTMKYYQKAIRLDPDNERYSKKYSEIKTEE